MRGIVETVRTIARQTAIESVKGISVSKTLQFNTQAVGTGNISKIKGDQVTVEMNDGSSITAQLSGNQYANIGSTVSVINGQVV